MRCSPHYRTGIEKIWRDQKHSPGDLFWGGQKTEENCEYKAVISWKSEESRRRWCCAFTLRAWQQTSGKESLAAQRITKGTRQAFFLLQLTGSRQQRICPSTATAHEERKVRKASLKIQPCEINGEARVSMIEGVHRARMRTIPDCRARNKIATTDPCSKSHICDNSGPLDFDFCNLRQRNKRRRGLRKNRIRIVSKKSWNSRRCVVDHFAVCDRQEAISDEWSTWI